jgi:hypothetical protein
MSKSCNKVNSTSKTRKTENRNHSNPPNHQISNSLNINLIISLMM